MSTSRTFQIKMVRPDEEEMAYFWKLFYAAQRVEDRWGYGLADISEELSYCPGMTREQKLFLLRAWQVLAADKGGFGRLMGAYDTYVHNMQDPDDDCVAWKPSLIELFGSAELLPVVMEAYQEALQRIAELEREQQHLRPVGVMSEKAFHRLESSECRFIALWPRPGIYLPRKRPEDCVIVYARTAAAGITLKVGGEDGAN